MRFDAVLDQWLRRLETIGFDVTAYLRPGVSEQELDQLELRIGFALPLDYRALYRRADGQDDSFRIKPAAGAIAVPLFGSYDFIDLTRGMSDYAVWEGIVVDAGAAFATTFDQCTARAGDPVSADYWRPGWLPFARDGGGNCYAVDLAPLSGGTYGQIILFGPDEDERRVLAPSITALLAHMATREIRFDESHESWRCFDIEQLPHLPTP